MNQKLLFQKKSLSIFFFLLLLPTFLFAQQASVAAGGNAIGTNGSSSYSIGQVVYASTNGNNGFLTQGVQQPFEISVVLDVKQDIAINVQFNAYPNPTTNTLLLKSENSADSILNYQLSDESGKLIFNKKISEVEMVIPMDYLASGIYFLSILEKNAVIKTFKIIKK